MNKKYSSLWVEKISADAYPPLNTDLSVEVAVIGGGISGLTAALLLQQKGFRIALLEANRIGAGTTGYSTAKVTVLHSLIYGELKQHYDAFTSHVYAQTNKAGMEKVSELIDTYTIDCDLIHASAYTYTLDEAKIQKLEDEVIAAREAGLNMEFVTEIDLPYPIAGAVHISDQIMIDPYRYSVGLALALHGHKGLIYEQCRVISCEEDADTYLLNTQDGFKIRAQRVIIATQLPFMNQGAFFARTSPHRSYLMASRLSNPAQMPQGMYISIDDPAYTLRPAFNGEYLITGGQAHAIDTDISTKERYDAVQEWTSRHFDVASVEYKWSAMDFIPVDHLPLVGRLNPDSRDIYIITGLRKWGLTNGTAAAMILADLIQNQPNPWHKTFDSLRLNLWQGMPELLSENLNNARHFISGKLNAINSPDADTLQPGEAGLVQYQGELVAAYRDMDNTWYAVAPACTHMGCNVIWNEAETSWDCPCHGSRFKPNGEIIQGPAVKNLERKN